MPVTYPRFCTAGDTAILIELGAGIDRTINRAVMALNTRISQAGLEGLVETVPTFRSVLISYDPLKTSGAAVREKIQSMIDEPVSQMKQETRLWRLPVCYDGEDFAPDLADVSARTGLKTDDVISRHLEGTYHVYMLGTYPGYGFMGDVDPALSLPRRTNPRLRVPAGSVAITGKLTGIYPLEAPGGWNIIGRSPVRLFDPTWPVPALLRPGDRVQLERVELQRFADIADGVGNGTWRPECEVQAL